MASGGLEVAQHRLELEPIIRSIISEHTRRKGCAWEDNAVENILRGLGDLVESQEICREQSW
jgi:hypothetical protein